MYLLQGLAKDSYEYFEEEDESLEDSDDESSLEGGDYIVGGRAVSTTKFPFLVGWNSAGMNKFSCSGIVLTPRYFLSAAHCNTMIDQLEEREEKRKLCVMITATGQSYKSDMRNLKLKCRWLKCKKCKDQDLEVITEPKGRAWINVENEENANEENMHEIKRHIRHAKSYKGNNGYGTYGGYDITLVEVETPMKVLRPACLPGPKFDDIRLKEKNSMVAGYGKYLRSNGETCETNKHGEMKKHYCDTAHGMGGEACITNKPAPRHPECKAFFQNQKTPTRFEKEIRLIDETGNKIAICFPRKNPENATYGWCKTIGNYYDSDNVKVHSKGWGFCGKDCFLNTTTNGGTLRSKEDIEILSEEQCDKFLTKSFIAKEVEVTPEILCVAKTTKWVEETWQKTDSGYAHVEQHDPARRYGSTGYVASVGTCKGDSGGPLFVKDGKNFVVTGECCTF